MTKEQFILHLIRSLILEYRLSLETVNQLGLIKNSHDLYHKIINQENLDIKGALIYILNYESQGSLVNQREAKKEALKFLSKFSKAKDTKERINLINDLNDNSEVNEIKKKKGRMNESDINLILKYRYKYCISKKETAKIFNIFDRTLDYWENDITDQNFKDRLNAINDFKRITEFNGLKYR